MNITIVFFLSLLIALIGVIPPGLLNMTAAKISLKEGYNSGFIFSIGVCVVVGVQTTIAAVFAKYLNAHPAVIDILKRVALVIFLLISVYFIFTASKVNTVQTNDVARSKQSRFFQGIFMSALNMFPIPYQLYMVTTLAAYGWLTFDQVSIGAYVSGACTGTFMALYFYILFFEKLRHNKITTPKTMNYVIGLITAFVALMTLIDILREL